MYNFCKVEAFRKNANVVLVPKGSNMVDPKSCQRVLRRRRIRLCKKNLNEMYQFLYILVTGIIIIIIIIIKNTTITIGFSTLSGKP